MPIIHLVHSYVTNAEVTDSADDFTYFKLSIYIMGLSAAASIIYFVRCFVQRSQTLSIWLLEVPERAVLANINIYLPAVHPITY